MSNTSSMFATASVVTLGLLAVASTQGQDMKSGQARLATSVQYRTTDYMVPHISTVPANAGSWVELFVREKIQRGGPTQRPVVLMIHGATSSGVPVFDVQFEDYSWMEYLANAGFDVFAMDHTGYGLSPRPMMDNPCNSAQSEQQLYLIRNPLAQPCAPTYPYQLTSLQSDWDEIDTVVEYLRELRNVEKVSIVGWSRGGMRGSSYAARYPEKVDRLVLLAPGYFPLSPSEAPALLPLPGVPSTVQGIADFHSQWDSQVKCEKQFNPDIRHALNWTILAFDPLASTWGTAGARRSPVWNGPPGFVSWGWNTEKAAQLKAPTLVIRGDFDTQVPLANIQAFNRDMTGVRQKVYVNVACASHYLHWENQHLILFRASVEWLQKGTFAGESNGSFAVSKDGQVLREK